MLICVMSDLKAQVAELQGGMKIRMEHMEKTITAEGPSAQLSFIYIMQLFPVNDDSCYGNCL